MFLSKFVFIILYYRHINDEIINILSMFLTFRLYPIEDNIGISIKAMSGRTPSFIVVGLVIIMFLLGLFYMSCSSKNSELRLSLEQYEERIRSVKI